MTKELQTAFAQELLDQSQLYRANAHLSHGVPGMPPRNIISDPKPEPPPPPPAPEPTVKERQSETTIIIDSSKEQQAAPLPAPAPVPASPPAQMSSAFEVPKWAMAAGLAGSLGLAGLGGYLAGGRPNEPPQRSATEVVGDYRADEEAQEGDLLRYFRKVGYNYPSEAVRRGK